jgi:glyoxylase-like metal-dependent hydrolase (beta-lactamase superfamily II)
VREARVRDLGGGVYQVTQPLPWALDHVHCYAVRGQDGYTLIDAGLGTANTIHRWQRALESIGAGRVARIIVTHYHPDHNGASRGLASLTSADEVVQGRVDRDRTRLSFLDPAAPARFGAYLRQLGMSEADAHAAVADEQTIPYDAAEPDRLVAEGDTIELGGERFTILHLPGHADGHIVLWGPDSGRMFGGDVLLDGITPNIGLWEDSLGGDPLGDYLVTLSRIEQLQPRLVYPGHRALITTPALRAGEIRSHHHQRLDAAAAALGNGPVSPYQVSRVLWGNDLSSHEQRFALVEAHAHLAYLARHGRAQRVGDYLYQEA